jgi:outer membrane protein, heavy metal efflux system
VRNFSKLKVYALLAAMLTSGCAVWRYKAAPLEPVQTAAMLQARSLDDPHLRTFIETNLGHQLPQWPPRAWDLETLSLAAFYFNPALDAARARAEEARAAVVTAGGRPNPTLSLAPGIPSPYLFSLDFTIPVETAGKRGHRVQIARSLNEAARLDLADATWKVRSEVRAALLDYLLASRSLDFLRSEEQVRADELKLLEQRLAVGEIPRPDVDLARVSLSQAHLGVRTAEGQLAESKAVLAASIGISVAGLRDFEFSWPDLDAPPNVDSLPTSEIQRDAVVNRLDVRRSLVQYAAAEADLQLEIAKQYPDVQIGPGYTYEEGKSYFTVGFSTTLPIFNRNQGPIAEAEARRKKAGAAFVETQARVIAASERALALYSAAFKAFVEAAQSLDKLQEARQHAMQTAVRAGEEDQLALDSVRIETLAGARTRLAALNQAQVALGGLEDAVQRPLAAGEALSVSPNSPALTKVSQESKR